MLEKPVLFAKVVGYIFVYLWQEIRRAGTRRTDALLSWNSPKVTRDRNIVIIGANFAGYAAARAIGMNLPPNSPYKVVVIEPNSHFQFTWVLPRFCVAKGHEHKAFIPYGGWIKSCPEGAIRWVRDRVVGLTKTHVTLQDSDEEIPYEYLIIATGSAVEEGLPSRTNATDKIEGMRRLQAMQNSIEKAQKIVVVGGGAAGVEVATDAISKYPNKAVILVHSRSALMHRFGKGLQEAALEGFDKLGGETILEERVVNEDKAAGTVTLRSGRVIECDLFINCTGQKPASGILKDFAPNVISESGHIKVKKTLQLDDPSLSNIYACGDVADTKTPNPNGRSANRQADVVSDNVLLAVRSKEPSYEYRNFWADGIIKLTLGLDRSVTHMGDGKSELLWGSKEKDEALMAAQCWWRLGQKAFEDDSVPQDKVAPIFQEDV
ncbi:Fc.00g027700.m01.CDS01 [Cosmosporella sp. VM-42]